ncbi:MAG: hypothetical protein ABI461_21780, partial [Polyangiaceae bacterium]
MPELPTEPAAMLESPVGTRRGCCWPPRDCAELFIDEVTDCEWCDELFKKRAPSIPIAKAPPRKSNGSRF